MAGKEKKWCQLIQQQQHAIIASVKQATGEQKNSFSVYHEKCSDLLLH